MKKEIKQLIDLSRKLGNDKKQTLAAGGNTSYKNNRFVWLKASGTRLGSMTEKSLVQCDRKKLEQLLEKKYSNNPDLDFEKAKADLLRSVIDPASRLQPSVEALLHVILPQPFVVHTHPTLVNALVCSRNADQTVQQLFGDRALLIPYRYPGLSLFLQVNVELKQYRKRYHRDPAFIFLKNHGVIVSGDTPEEIDARFEQIFTKIRPLIQNEMTIETLPGPDATTEILPAIRMMLSNKHLQILCVRRNALIDYFAAGRRQFEKVGQPFCFDHVKYNGAAYLFVDTEQNDPQSILKAFEKELVDFRDQNEGDLPRIILIKGWGLIATAQNARDAETRMALFEDQMQISFYAENFGGPVYLDREQIELIQKRMAVEEPDLPVHVRYPENLVQNRVAVVTGGAQGFGEGIARDLFRHGSNVVIADIKEEEGKRVADELNSPQYPQKILFVKADVSDSESVQNMIRQTVTEFGGVDLMISNAGVLLAGSLDEMEPDTFDFVTKVNYKGYYLCTKYASRVMKLQSNYHPNHYSDIIQINSKSGLKGSNKNFAYAGGKFGGVGLTQSFALELMPFHIKVNSVCPGNLFDGPLWSDPEKGLFVQYLRTGKVAGAKTLADVKRYYEAQVPAQRGCTVADVMKAIYYIIDQQYETGQAVPVTGGQIMLS